MLRAVHSVVRTVRLAQIRSWNGGRKCRLSCFLFLPVLKYCEVTFDVQSANLSTGGTHPAVAGRDGIAMGSPDPFHFQTYHTNHSANENHPALASRRGRQVWKPTLLWRVGVRMISHV